MRIIRNTQGAITNAEQLTVDDVVLESVVCPACRAKTFANWPWGWDSHSGWKCSASEGGSPKEKKASFKRRFSHLFRKK